MKVFIDDFNLIRIESNVYIHSITIEGYHLNWYKNVDGNQYFKTDRSLLLHKNDHIWINYNKYPLYIGLVTLRDSFEKRFRYDGPLGYIYNKEFTEFFLFTPVAKEVNLVIGDKIYEMIYREPIWYIKIKGDFELKPYHYQVRLVNEFHDVEDPYAIGYDSINNVIVDLEKLNTTKTDYKKLNKYTDAVIYEGHVRDLTIDLDVEDRGTFSGLTNHSKILNSSVLEYIKNLGITHLQLLPINDFYGVDDFNKDKSYNWGYNPKQYFAIKGWYSKDPLDPYLRMNEFKNLVDEAHKLGLGINLDVVYNHVYQRVLYPYDYLVPGYFYRHDKHFKSTHSCFLDNDIETTNYMVRRLIVDSLVYFIRVYKVDGFRFDLMGLMDKDTMNLIDKTLRSINPSVMLYGEGWNMDMSLPKNLRSNMNNQHLMNNIAHFNDFYRDTFKGHIHTNKLGFSTGNKHNLESVSLAIKGSPNIFDNPIKSINFIECHDNMTLYDTLSLNYNDETVKLAYQDLSNHLISFSIGVPFYHAGQEMYRSKNGDYNSYMSSDEINSIKWYDYSSVKNFKKALKIRKQYKEYRNHTYNDNEVTVEVLDDYLLYQLKSKTYILNHYIKNDFKETVLPVSEKLIFNSQKVYTNKDTTYVNKPGVYIIKKKRDIKT